MAAVLVVTPWSRSSTGLDERTTVSATSVVASTRRAIRLKIHPGRVLAKLSACVARSVATGEQGRDGSGVDEQRRGERFPAAC
jgi:hypothetical protein